MDPIAHMLRELLFSRGRGAKGLFWFDIPPPTSILCAYPSLPTKLGPLLPNIESNMKKKLFIKWV
jgi:hypothetical protein